MRTIGKQRKTTFWIIGGAIIFGAAVVSGIAVYSISMVAMNHQRLEYEEQLAGKAEQISRYETKSISGYVLKVDKAAGDVLLESDLSKLALPDYFTPSNIVNNAADAIGKTIKINAEKGTAVTSDMIYTPGGKLEAGLRKEEAEYIRLPLRVGSKDIVDIRILFPNGEDYVVLSKKQLDDVDINPQIAFFVVNEDELHLLRSAMVDAYTNEAELYAIQYVEPHLQSQALVTYVPQVSVLNVIKSNPNIGNTARWELADKIRQGIDERLKAMDKSGRTRLGSAPPPGSSASSRKLQPAAERVSPAPAQGQTAVNKNETTGEANNQSGLLGGK
ncbi:SAF domain-containing protein [Paenibacillus puerhi]|uniref:SAF domain-containing protein n=1 Tax=Paenibacillus puerhi TaxID=2692622 RepID=UPI001358F094|nr:SAF domain-containing protein [Paenibacillus puerhi]